MSDLVKRQDAINKFVGLNMQVYEGDRCVGIRTYITKEEIIYAIDELPSVEPERKWIPVTERLPEEGESVIVCSQYGAICIVELVKGISEETRKKMKNGEIDDPCENIWCLSDGHTISKRSDLYKEGDEFGNNQKDYAWKNGPYHYSGQDFIAWMPLPEPWRGEQ